LTAAELVAKHLVEVEDFLDDLEKAEDDEERDDEYRRISKLVRFSQRFYEKFLSEQFDLDVTSFSFDDKRLVAEQISEEEEGREDDEVEDPRLDLAYSYLEICDQLHGELEFGYAVDVGDFVEFHKETFPDWLGEVAEWLSCNSQKPLAGEVLSVSEHYRRVA
jgi:hypothetical protein